MIIYFAVYTVLFVGKIHGGQVVICGYTMSGSEKLMYVMRRVYPVQGPLRGLLLPTKVYGQKNAATYQTEAYKFCTILEASESSRIMQQPLEPIMIYVVFEFGK